VDEHAGLRQNERSGGKKYVPHDPHRVPSNAGSPVVVNQPSIAGTCGEAMNSNAT
jgi:hypothetical protein